MIQGKTPSFVIVIVIYLTINHSRLDSNFGRPLKCPAMQPVTASVLISRPSDTTGRWLIHPLMKVLLVSFHGTSKNSTLLSKGIQQENSLKCNRRRTTKSVILWTSFCQVSLIAPFFSCHPFISICCSEVQELKCIRMKVAKRWNYKSFSTGDVQFLS